MPSLTARALAEMLRLPAFDQARILHGQKYPKQQPQVFRTPYYQPAITAIRAYYASGNLPASLATARNQVQSISVESRRTQILRVLDAFEGSQQSKRILSPVPNTRMLATMGDVDIRLSADLRASDSKRDRFFYYNCRQIALDPEVAHLTAEIAHWVLQQSGQDIALDQVEVVDLATGKALKYTKRRPTTMRLVSSNVRIIDALWAAI